MTVITAADRHRLIALVLSDMPTSVHTFDLVAHLRRQKVFSTNTFGPGQRCQGVLDHIRKELDEIAKHPADLYEWADVILLALDGAWRAGHEPEQVAAAIARKQAKNELREWPDWRAADPNKAIEHVHHEHGEHTVMSPSDAARMVEVLERELSALLSDGDAENHSDRCTLYFDQIARYRARAGLPASMEA